MTKIDIYQIKGTLKEIRPPAWRRRVRGDTWLGKLHDILQIAMAGPTTRRTRSARSTSTGWEGIRPGIV